MVKRITQDRNLAIKLAAKQKGQCARCKCDLSKVDEVHIDHIIPISKGGGEEENNKQLLCKRCNLSKGARLEVSALNQTYLPKQTFEDWDFKNDPFLKRYKSANLVPWTMKYAWEAEFVKRMYAMQFKRVDFLNTETWFWKMNMVKELAALPVVGDDQKFRLAVHPDVGVGCHFFQADLDTRTMLNLVHPEHDGILVALMMWIRPDATVEYVAGTEREGHAKLYWLPWHVGNDDIAAKITTLLNQRLVSTKRARPPFTMRRKEKTKKGRKAIDEAKITQVIWRQLSNLSISKGAKVAWDKHWWVKGHWRKQPYPSEGVYRLKFILPHQKGNLNAPLYNSPKVNVVCR